MSEENRTLKGFGDVWPFFSQEALAETERGEIFNDYFAYWLGLQHHVPDTEIAIANVACVLKLGVPFLVYFCYVFDNRPWWFRLLWGLTDGLRRVICRLLPPLRNFPLAYYRDKSSYVMRADALDLLGTRLENASAPSR